jgi:hypothetical protein
MPGGIYFSPETPPLRCGTNLPFGIYLAPATPPLRYDANVPFGIYLAPETAPLRHTLIAVERVASSRFAALHAGAAEALFSIRHLHK